MGSSCYINSTLQCLNGATDFRNNFGKISIPENVPLLPTFQSLFVNLWESQGVSAKLLREFRIQCGGALNKKYIGLEHQDINEYLMELLEFTDQELKKIENPSNQTLIENYFDGRLVRTRTCPQGHSSKSFESFRILPLQFPLVVKSTTDLNRSFLQLTDMIQESLAEETLEW